MELIYWLILIIFVASFIKGTFGFGDGLIAIPTMSILLPIVEVTPMFNLLSMVIVITMMIQERQSLDFNRSRQLFPFIFVGIIIGIFLLKLNIDVHLKIGLAVITISFGLINLFESGKQFVLSHFPKASFFYGLLGGVTGGALNTAGPPILMYCVVNQWKHKEYRSNLQALFLVMNVFVLIGHISTGLVTDLVIERNLYLFPALVLGFIAGSIVHRRINPENFEKYVYIIMVFMGITLLASVF